MKVTLARRGSATEAMLYEAEASQVAVGSGSLVVSLADGETVVMPLDEIGNLIITSAEG